MPLKSMSEYKRNDYTYESPDGEQYEITIVQTSDRKYVEIKRDSEDGTDEVSWDVEMLLDIADAVRAAVHKPSVAKTHSLRSPKVIDHRGEGTPSETIQASVDESLESIEKTDEMTPIQSFSPTVEQEIENRKQREPGSVPAELRIKRK